MCTLSTNDCLFLCALQLCPLDSGVTLCAIYKQILLVLLILTPPPLSPCAVCVCAVFECVDSTPRPLAGEDALSVSLRRSNKNNVFLKYCAFGLSL